MNRQSMRTLIFRDPEAKLLLEQIIHPLVSKITAEQALAATQSGRNLLIFDVPLLVESGDRWRQQLDRVVVIDCDEATQRQRVMLRSGLSDHEVQSIMSQQASREQRLSCADVVIVNQHLNFDELEALVAHVALDFGL
jgi:dephospho-CoA kinase